MLLWLTQGKVALKTALADRSDPGTATLPLREEVIAAIRAAQRTSRPVYLASASDRRYVERLAVRVGGIEGVFGTDASVNLKGRAKAQRLVAEFGAGRFDYMGDASADFPVWQEARKVLALIQNRGLEKRLLKTFPSAEIVARQNWRTSDYLRMLRPHQWVKNILVFLPMIAGHQFNAPTIFASLIAFICFCMASSSAYLINDLLDLPGDRDHPRKRLRPFAAGDIPLRHGLQGRCSLAPSH